jgi:hypothetical protein
MINSYKPKFSLNQLKEFEKKDELDILFNDVNNLLQDAELLMIKCRGGVKSNFPPLNQTMIKAIFLLQLIREKNKKRFKNLPPDKNLNLIDTQIENYNKKLAKANELYEKRKKVAAEIRNIKNKNK